MPKNTTSTFASFSADRSVTSSDAVIVKAPVDAPSAVRAWRAAGIESWRNPVVAEKKSTRTGTAGGGEAEGMVEGLAAPQAAASAITTTCAARMDQE